MKMKFAERLKEARRARGMSLQDLASKTGTTRAQLCWYEHGKHEPKLCTLLWIAEALDVSMDWLAGRDTKKGRRSNEQLCGETETSPEGKGDVTPRSCQ